MLERFETRLVEAAEEAARALPYGDTHTVAAAALDAEGGVHLGVNVHHFTGGPCAEAVALGVAAAAGAGPLIAMVAVGDGGRGVLAPCGRCRQMLLDLHPDIRVILPAPDSGLLTQPVRALLPLSYVPSRVAGSPRVVHLDPALLEPVRSGRCTATVRHDAPLPAGPVLLVFAGNEVRRLSAHVDSAEPRALTALSDHDARAAGCSDAAALRALVRRRHPGLHDDDVVEVVRFHLTGEEDGRPR